MNLGQKIQRFSNTQMIPLLLGLDLEKLAQILRNVRLDEVEFNSLVAAAANQGRSLSRDSLLSLINFCC